jgi:hypothetical protein
MALVFDRARRVSCPLSIGRVNGPAVVAISPRFAAISPARSSPPLFPHPFVPHWEEGLEEMRPPSRDEGATGEGGPERGTSILERWLRRGKAKSSVVIPIRESVPVSGRATKADSIFEVPRAAAMYAVFALFRALLLVRSTEAVPLSPLVGVHQSWSLGSSLPHGYSFPSSPPRAAYSHCASVGSNRSAQSA